jgi:hypothetical protein
LLICSQVYITCLFVNSREKDKESGVVGIVAVKSIAKKTFSHFKHFSFKNVTPKSPIKMASLGIEQINLISNISVS